ncbi:FHA domain-containing protein [Diaminobutyricibacter tongyongensis]|uniref:FHA domain-containing protein n=1 Tax=Leifsonia tongyongensis TaxID=1268043 RepID=UPI0030844161
MTATRVRPPVVVDPRTSDTTIVEPLPKPAVVGRFPAADDGGRQAVVSVESAPIVPDPAHAMPADAEPAGGHHTFTLSFSTGEIVTVRGDGLLGRRPIAQPGESFDQLIAITDPGRSVSKTHLEFGLEGDELWLCDRYSGNGTIVRPPGGVTRQFEPGRRYRVARGTRVEIGDQYFDVN